ncbi:thioredoxin domain-containing protein [Corynebacterium lizhenjunii]|uniref:Thioredoxin domain-containing protein n=1 Tax=Corynebacterium lizhenjunii TaxID=2709394 RepID=A0A7T0PBL5_9CORY|nr:thioredoxin domain-containing protein [Corynebacterium lizhenjunii]QPK78852.1 thioredoxin domain-containing protein [Corynebacterium lizhenjunii]
MSKKVTNPNAKGSSGFLWGLVALLAIIAAVIAYIVWNGQGAKTEHLAERELEDVSMTMEYKDGAILLSSANTAKDAPTLELYEDYSCPHCSELAEATDEDMKAAIEAGEFNVLIRPLNFLDVSGKELTEDVLSGATGHSTKAAAAMNALAATGDAKTYWNLRTYLMEDQEKVYNKWDATDFAHAAKQMGASADTADAVKAADLKAQGGDIAAANAMRLKEETGTISSPRVIYQGKDFDEEGESILDWVEKAKAL